MSDVRGVYRGLLDDTDRVDYLYRISLKAVIYDKDGHLLVTNEAGRGWHLPGGGMEHGETIEAALRRELQEEIGYDGPLTYKVIGAEPMWMGDELNMWQMWIVMKVEINNFDFMDGRSQLIDPEVLKNSDSRDSQLSYAYSCIM